ncbi:MAG: transporter substrate-binding domain-containing protein [Gammaproteobacteria bacterium]|nr:transporter substrate-binding domain-containing protein [Gammaproteobacteria bacterium]MCP5199834.1 transporter substrate-binding domain-containing protein [Gammaproteobacteria bacterium]
MSAAGRAWANGAAALVALFASMAAVAAGPTAAPALKVCMLANSMPYSARAGATGFDVDVAAAVAAEAGYRLEPVWIDAPDTIQELDEGDMPLERLAREDCDAIFSVPGPAAETLRGHDALTLGAPYYGAAFELMRCKPDTPGNFRALRGQRVAIQSQTVAHFALLTVKAEPRNYFSLGQAFDAVRAGDVDAALLWGPALGYHLRMLRVSGLALREPAFAACELVAGYEPPTATRWNLHVATRKERTRMREHIDQALAHLAKEGRLAKLAEAWGVPWHAPFDGTYSLGALDELRRPQH